MCNEYSGWQHVKGVIPSACLLANRGFAVAMVQYRGSEVVSFGQSCMLYDKLVQCKKEATFYAIENAHHGGRAFWSDQILDIIEAFIKREE